LTYAAAGGHAFIDRALHLPRCWVDDPDRCRTADVPEGVEFATKPALARAMIARALDVGTPASWVSGDEVYGNDPHLRAELHQRRIGYVLAVACDHHVPTGAGKIRADALATRVPKHGRQRLSCGDGAKGRRYYDWASVDLTVPTHPGNTGC